MDFVKVSFTSYFVKFNNWKDEVKPGIKPRWLDWETQVTHSETPRIARLASGPTPHLQVMKRENESSLMQLREEYCKYEQLRCEHDKQIVQIAHEAGLRIAPDQWSSLLYGDMVRDAHNCGGNFQES